MTLESQNTKSTGDAGASGVTNSLERNSSIIESRIKLWTAIVTLLGVIVGFAYTTHQLLDQGKNLEKIEQNFSSLERLKKALMMPLEGFWDYKVEYIHYFGKTEPRHVSRGKAVFVWRGSDNARIGYSIFIGAGVKEIGMDKAESLVTYVIDFFLDTDQSGSPKENCAATGTYVSRTTSEKEFARPSDTEVEISGCKVEFSAINTINKLTFKYKALATDERQLSDANVIFERR